MAYTSYEILPAREINNRVVPRLWKLIRQDGTFDLYNLATLQQNCLPYLASVGQAGAFSGRWNSGGVNDLGYISIANDWCSPLYFSTYMKDSTHYHSYPYCGFRIVLDNNARLYPYQIFGYNRSDHGGGERCVRVGNNGVWTNRYYGTGNLGESLLYGLDLSNLSSVIDWKDYSELQAFCRAWDTSKYTGAYSAIYANFIHRYSEEHPLYRYYR